MASKTRSYHGMLVSLYHTIKPEFVEHLEQAIWTSKVGKYEDALTIFQNFLHPILDVPVVLIELSYLHYQNFRYRDLCNLLEPILDRLKRDDPTKLDDPEWRLLALIYCVGANRCRGWMDPGIRELRRTQIWLSELPVSEYTELHVHCVWRYVIAYLMTRLQTGLEGNLDDYHRIPLPNEASSTSPWKGLGDLRCELVKQGRWKEANAIFKPELNRTLLKQRRNVAEGFLQDLDGCLDPKRNYMIAVVRLQMAKAMVDVHDLNLAKQDTQSCIKALDQWCVDVGIAKDTKIPLQFEIEQLQLGFISDYEEKLQTAMNLAERMSEFGHSDYSRCLNIAAETANKASKLTGNLQYRKQCLILQERLERINEEVTGDICDLATHVHEVHSLAQHTNVDAQKAIEWIDGFLAKYHEFKAPRIMESLYIRKFILLQTLGDSEGAQTAHTEALKWDALTGSWKGVNSMSSSNVVAPGDGALGEVPYDSEDDNDDGEDFFDGWKNVYGADRAALIINKMIEFALQDFAGGRLSIADVIAAFSLPDNVEANALEDALNGLKFQDQQQLFKFLWMPKSSKDGKEEDKSNEEKRDNTRYEFVREWLQKPVRGSRDRRLMCLMRFLDVHSEMASEEGLREMAIRDCENLLSLWETLPHMLKELTSSGIYSWHALIAGNYWSMFISGGKWTLFNNYGYLYEVDKRCDLAIEGYRKTGQITGLANIERLQAQIGLVALRRLIIYKALSAKEERAPIEEQVMKVSKDEFGEVEEAEKSIPLLREKGLKLLTETDAIYSKTEREASWEDGLEGIQKRKEMSRMQMSYTTTRYAIRYWIEGEDKFSEEARIAIWNLTQNLIQRIQASDTESLIYKEMVDLQRQIDEAKTKDRFYLRLRLDDHRQKMKSYPLLRQLIDLREGTPFSLDDVENVARNLEDDIILVDWFYLDSFFDRGKLLLLTVRKGEVPTIDEIQVDVQAIEKWKKDYLNASGQFQHTMERKLGSTLSIRHFNEACGAIIQPLAKRTKMNDILVLCPTEFLNGIPLHALIIDEEALIRRNPCVYVHSLSLLRPCSSAAQYASDTASPVNPKFLSGIAGIGQDTIDFRAGRDTTVELARQLQGKLMIDESATKSNFIKQANESRLFHIQTHCSWDSNNPLDHHIEFAAQGGKDVKNETLTARDVFALRLQQGAHLNVIACSSALTEVKAGDEVMGLVPALLYSGASSVISTLWPTHDDVGAEFSKVFFDSFLRQRNEDDKNWINVARAAQKGVMALDPEQNEGLLRWASIVLNG